MDVGCNVSLCCIDVYLSTFFIYCSNASHLLGFYIVAIIRLSEVTLSSHLPLAETLKMAVLGIIHFQ